MNFLEWLEMSRLADWSSIEGYSIIITAHSIGLAVMVGTIMMIDLRLLGCFKAIPYSALSRMLSVAWLGFVVNFLSGIALFSMQSTAYVTMTVFLIKMSLILFGALSAAQQHILISRNASAWTTSSVPRPVHIMAIFSLIFWSGAIIAGRLIAYIS